MLEAVYWLEIPDWYYAIVISWPIAESSTKSGRYLSVYVESRIFKMYWPLQTAFNIEMHTGRSAA